MKTPEIKLVGAIMLIAVITLLIPSCSTNYEKSWVSVMIEDGYSRSEAEDACNDTAIESELN
ncbi:hypothetical protein [Crocinitomix algicola]|uniref:hypothetical protein n=1 Tax=Crocinitomix algicola TaxID=1740263 RepID=UPI0008341AEC|nr:hypothetical protein [Crocinitomix algicola]